MNATLEHIWHEFAEKLGQFIRARVSDPATAEDISQDVFVKIQQRLGQLQDPAKLQSWIYLIARNAVIDIASKTRTNGEIFENATNAAFLEQGKGAACPDTASFVAALDEAEKKLQAAFPAAK